MTAPTLSEFYLNSRSTIVGLDLFVFTHPNFSQTYRVVRNAIKGVTVTHEDTSAHTYDYYPIQIDPTETRENLDVGFTVQIADVGLVIPLELDLIKAADNFITKPQATYRQYRSDRLDAPMNGPWTFEIRNITTKSEGAIFELAVPRLNINSVGEIYTPVRFPMLYGAL